MGGDHYSYSSEQPVVFGPVVHRFQRLGFRSGFSLTRNAAGSGRRASLACACGSTHTQTHTDTHTHTPARAYSITLPEYAKRSGRL